MLLAAIIAVVILMAAVAYVVFHKFSVVRQEIEFTAPQDGVAAIHLDIHEDTCEEPPHLLRRRQRQRVAASRRRLNSIQPEFASVPTPARPAVSLDEPAGVEPH